MCSTLRPRSSTSVLRPLSHSSLAAQPPVMPEPTTMASKVLVSLLFTTVIVRLIGDANEDQPRSRSEGRLTAQDAQDFFELGAKLTHDLLRLGQIIARFVALEAIARAADREALFVQEAADLADHEHVLALVVAAVAATLDRLELREFLFPVTQHVRLHPAQIAHLTDGEVALAGNR